MKTIKYIREIAEKLPTVFEQTVSGYTVVEGEAQPNYVNHPINHTRRLRKAYEKLGMDGIRSYLEYIHKLQIDRNERVQKLQELERQKEQVGDQPVVS